MDKFPDWAEKLLKGPDTGPRPHTLNLVLKLADPCKLPLMLLDVVVNQPVIDRAMKDLAFIHYARFVPSWDGTALVVTTEFDGPMKAYVMDFVISLGGLFNKLLSYVEEPPKLPVQQYPDEFWAFVEKWNRVPFAPRSGSSTATVFPADYDYPVYAAYPDKSVVEVIGPRDSRRNGLRPALDRRAAHVDLAGIQGNTLRGYRAGAARYVMLQVIDAAAARTWLAGLPVQDGQDWGKAQPQGELLNIAFTHEGLCALLPGRKEDLARFPEVFREGALARAELNGDVGSSAPEAWQFGGNKLPRVHVVLSLNRLAPATSADLDAPSEVLTQLANQHGLKWVHEVEAEALPGGYIHFGFADGISESRIAGNALPGGADRPSMQPASSPGEFLLGQRYDSIYGGESLGRHMPPDLADQGCYGAMRLIEQDVTQFATTVQGLAQKFHISPQEAGARLLGRWQNGQPLSLYPHAPGPNPLPGTRARNDFDYAPNWEYPDEPLDHEGSRCPLDAHVRRTNPRSHHAPGMRHTRRLLRRGLPASWTSKDGERHVGLLGLFLCGDLERQFEFMQQHWVQGGESHNSDAISGQRDGTTEFRWSPDTTVKIPPLVRTRGSLYLFFPGMQMLRRLPELNHARSSSQPTTSDRPALDDLGSELRSYVKRLKHLPPQTCELVIGWLVNNVLNSPALEALAKRFLPAPPPDLGQLPLLHRHDVDPLNTRFIADPSGTYQQLRNSGPSFFWEPSHHAFWALRRADVQRILTQHHEFVQAPSTTHLRGIITLDGADHARVRKAFWESMAVPMQQVGANLDTALQARLKGLGGLQQFDFVRDLGNPVLSEVYWEMFGLPEQHRQACSGFAALAMRQFNQPDPRRSGATAAQFNATVQLAWRLALQLALALLEDLSPLGRSRYEGTLLGGIAARTSLPVPGLGGPQRTLDFPTAVASLLQFVLAGHLAPQLVLSSAARNFLAHDVQPGQSVWAHLAALPQAARMAPLGIALEESRRFDPAVTIIQRYTAGIVRIGGVTLPKDAPVFAVAVSANRDGAPSQRLERFVWDRNPAPAHFSLGAGPHYCIGAAMQELMLPRLLSGVMRVHPGLRLVDRTANPAWIDNVYFRGLEALPVTT